MSEPQIPERLRLVGDHELERRLLDAAAGEQPSAELSERMAKAIGIAFVAPSPAGNAAVVKTAAVAKSGSGVALWSLVAAGVVAVAATALVLATRSRPAPAPPAQPVVPAAIAPAPAAVEEIAPAPAVEPQPAREMAAPSAPPAHRHANLGGGDLRAQIALLDAARAALVAKSYDRTLELLHRYREKYPTGSFQPEAAALTVEALVSAGRVSEARSLARRFVAEFGPSPLAERVHRQAGLSTP